MTPPVPFPRKIVAAAALVLALAGCQIGGTPRSVPTVPQIGGNLKCTEGDHGYEDQQAGWGFCYPSTWRYTERSQADSSPSGLDLTFDVTCLTNCKVPCPTAAAGSPAAQCPPPEDGLFAFMIISTYERGGSTSLTSWIQTNLRHVSASDSISWGNSVEATMLDDGRRIALTPHHVVIMDLHSGLLDLEGEMSSRLGTWKFTY
ncbi:MAG TPA: hypothetical protein VGT01_03075 [Candidatus Dormibacteraeota bacterium]|nr:hypothetical protein [Candidatus Dormibacteraeota bacterium]